MIGKPNKQVGPGGIEPPAINCTRKNNTTKEEIKQDKEKARRTLKRR
jgi:hypothetical protein